MPSTCRTRLGIRPVLLGAGLPEHLGERSTLLSPGHAVLPVDHEERHPLDAVRRRLGDVGLHVGEERLRLECRDHLGPVEPDLGGEVRKVVDAPDVASLDEVRLQEALLHVELATLALREVDQLVRFHRVGLVDVRSDTDPLETGTSRARPC
ncbi:hypothetical protein GCM10022197_04500 [Microlunatus spumicola]|uniref:Uncharacterized protein n=1 Tax=Microlunatus spumicola TaxID=81499 RepID=A0ABP6WQL9_9ACTN